MVRLSAHKHAHMKILYSVLNMLFFTHYNDLPPASWLSYIINVAVPFPTHKCFAFVPAYHSESVIHLIPLTLLLQPKEELRKFKKPTH